MKKIILTGLFIAVAIAIFLAPFASSHPDGLEKVADDKGFLHKGESTELFSAPIPDYEMPGVKQEKIAVSLAGIIGTLVTFLAAYGIGYLMKLRRKNVV